MDLPVIFFADYAIYLLFAAAGIYLLRQKNLCLVKSAVFSTLTSWLVAVFIKSFFYVPRPFFFSGKTPVVDFFYDGSFPSAHTILAFSLAVTVWLWHKRSGWIFLLFAFLIAASRVLGGVHRPIDILGGMIISAGVSYAFYRFVFACRSVYH